MKRLAISGLLLLGCFALQAQVITAEEGYISTSKKTLELLRGGFLVAVNASYKRVDFANFSILKFNDEGRVDDGFGRYGRYRHKAAYGSPEEKHVMLVEDMLELSDGKILVAGSTRDAGDDNLFLLRLQPMGIPDSSYGTNGYLYLKNTYLSNPIIRLQALANNNVLVGYVNEDGRIGSFRLNPNGTPDLTYGLANGQFSFFDKQQRCYFSSFWSIQSDSQGRLYFGSVVSTDQSGNIFQVYRVSAQGQLDQDFGKQGLTTLLTDQSKRNNYKAGNIAFFPNQQALVSINYSVERNKMNVGYHTVFKLHENGMVDTSFAQHGVAVLPVSPVSESFSSVTVLPDGKIMCRSIASLPAFNMQEKTKLLVSTRLTKGGQVDKTFGTGGVSLFPFLASSGVVDLKGIEHGPKFLYLFGQSYERADDPWLVTTVKVKINANGMIGSPVQNPFIYDSKDETGMAGIWIRNVNNTQTKKDDLVASKPSNTKPSKPAPDDFEARNSKAQVLQRQVNNYIKYVGWYNESVDKLIKELTACMQAPITKTCLDVHWRHSTDAGYAWIGIVQNLKRMKSELNTVKNINFGYLCANSSDLILKKIPTCIKDIDLVIDKFENEISLDLKQLQSRSMEGADFSVFANELKSFNEFKVKKFMPFLMGVSASSEELRKLLGTCR